MLTSGVEPLVHAGPAGGAAVQTESYNQSFSARKNGLNQHLTFPRPERYRTILNGDALMLPGGPVTCSAVS